MKKISEINVDSGKAAGNGGIASSSSKQFLANGDCSDCSYNSLSNDLSFPPGGIPSLRLPVVVVLNSSIVLPATLRISLKFFIFYCVVEHIKNLWFQLVPFTIYTIMSPFHALVLFL